MIGFVNRFIPFKAFTSMALWPFVFIRKENESLFTLTVKNHELIHGEQEKEMLVVGILLSILLCAVGCGWWSLFAVPVFFWIYGIEWIVKLCYYRNAMTAYKNVSFEREAYANQSDSKYIDNRKLFSWVKYIEQ